MSLIPSPIILCINFILLIVNTIICCTFLFSFSILKLLSPNAKLKRIFDKIVITIAEIWISNNSRALKFMTNIEVEAPGIEKLKAREWYLVISNHQSWVDIVILQMVLNRKIPFLKFFLKKELIWVPVLGLAWWALDFPFMKRYSKKFLESNPHLRGKDLESTKIACEKFKLNPVSVMNFVEGTRFTEEKKIRQKSPFKHLLNPKAGGIAFVLGAMGDYLNKIVNITIIYPNEKPNFWLLLAGKITKVHVNIEVTPVTDEMIGDYFNDSAFREYFQSWVNRLWCEKDKLIEEKM